MSEVHTVLALLIYLGRWRFTSQMTSNITVKFQLLEYCCTVLGERNECPKSLPPTLLSYVVLRKETESYGEGPYVREFNGNSLGINLVSV